MTAPITPTGHTFQVHLRGQPARPDDLARVIAQALEATFPGAAVTVTETADTLTPDEACLTAGRLAERFNHLRLPADALDDLTHQVGNSEEATRANADGLTGQLLFLLGHEMSEDDVLERLNTLADRRPTDSTA